MELFNKYYRSELQLLFDLFALNRPFHESEVQRLLRKNCMFGFYKDYLNLWENEKILIKNSDGMYQVYKNQEEYYSDQDLNSFVAPLSAIEKDALLELLLTNEVKLFLADRARETLYGMLAPWRERQKKAQRRESLFNYVVRQESNGKRTSKVPQPGVLHNILKAIFERRKVRYQYATNNDPAGYSDAKDVIPCRIEYSVFDGRWWLILHNGKIIDKKVVGGRAIKARLENIRNVEVLDQHGLSEQQLQDIITDGNLNQNCVRLRIRNNKNALERCFLTFSDMMEMEALRGEDKDGPFFELRFKYFRWDEKIVVQRLLYLGGCVEVLAPKEIITSLIEKVKESIRNINSKSVN